MADYSRDFPIKAFDKQTDMDWLALAWDEQKIPFDLQEGPLIKFLLICSADTSDLVIISHHCICDGLSMVYLVKDIAMYLDDPGMKVQALPLPPAICKENLAASSSADFIGALTKLLAYSLNRAWNKTKVLFSGNDYEKLYSDYWKRKNIGLLTVNLSKDMTDALIEKCRVVHVTVNSALTTAFSLAQYDLQGNRRRYLKKALLAISIRHLFTDPPGDNFGLLAIGNEIDLPCGKGGFWRIADRFHAKTKEMLANPRKALSLMAPLDYIEPTLFDAIYFVESGALNNKAARLFKSIVLSKTGKPKRSLDITNLGIVKDCSASLKTIYFVPILSSNYEKTIGIVTFGGEMNIVLMFDHSVIEQGMMESFKNKFLQNIHEAAND